MKNAIIFFLLGAITGVCSLMLYQRREGTPIPVGASGDASFSARAQSAISDAATKTSEAAGRAKDSAEDKLHEWHLTPDEIKDELAKTGEVVRTKARAAGEAIADARILAVIKSKYVLDRDLSAWDIVVEASDGNVTLTGKIASPDLVACAVRLALETDGVRLVTAKLIVTPKSG